MADWCSVHVEMAFSTKEDAEAYCRKLEKRAKPDRPVNIGAERPLFDWQLYVDVKGNVNVSGETRWDFERDDFVGVIKDAGPGLVSAQCWYCEENSRSKGTYGWSKDGPEAITDRYIPYEDWPEFDDDDDSDEADARRYRLLDDALDRAETHTCTFAEVEEQRVAREAALDEAVRRMRTMEVRNAEKD